MVIKVSTDTCKCGTDLKGVIREVIDVEGMMENDPYEQNDMRIVCKKCEMELRVEAWLECGQSDDIDSNGAMVPLCECGAEMSWEESQAGICAGCGKQAAGLDDSYTDYEDD